MAKSKGKHRSDKDKHISQEDSKTDHAAEVDLGFYEGPFAGLRHKIEERLKTQNEPKQSKTNDSNKHKNKKANKRDSSRNNSTSNAREPKPKASGKQKPAVKHAERDNTAKDKKRGRDGEVKKEGKNSGKDRPGDADTSDHLYREILTLGGNREDFDLLANVDSEEEVEGAVAKSETKADENLLRNELSEMLREAGHVAPDDLEDESDDSDQQDGGDQEAEEESEQVEGSGNTDESEDAKDGDSEEDNASLESDSEASKKNAKGRVGQAGPVLPKAYSELVSIFHVINQTILPPVLTAGCRPSFLDLIGMRLLFRLSRLLRSRLLLCHAAW